MVRWWRFRGGREFRATLIVRAPVATGLPYRHNGSASPHANPTQGPPQPGSSPPAAPPRPARPALRPGPPNDTPHPARYGTGRFCWRAGGSGTVCDRCAGCSGSRFRCSIPRGRPRARRLSRVAMRCRAPRQPIIGCPILSWTTPRSPARRCTMWRKPDRSRRLESNPPRHGRARARGVIARAPAVARFPAHTPDIATQHPKNTSAANQYPCRKIRARRGLSPLG